MSASKAGRGPGRRGALSRLLAGCLSVALLAAACATGPRPATSRPDVVVLLPDAEGKAGAIVVSAAGGTQVLTEPRQAVTVAPGASPAAPRVMSDDEVREVAGPALAALPERPARFVLYFDNDSTRLTAASRARIPDVVRAAKARRAPDVGVVGHTDTVGGRRYNERLGLQRARAVAALLAAGGVRRSLMNVVSHGKTNLPVPTGDQVPEPRNRCVEVTVR